MFKYFIILTLIILSACGAGNQAENLTNPMTPDAPLKGVSKLEPATTQIVFNICKTFLEKNKLLSRLGDYGRTYYFNTNEINCQKLTTQLQNVKASLRVPFNGSYSLQAEKSNRKILSDIQTDDSGYLKSYCEQLKNQKSTDISKIDLNDVVEMGAAKYRYRFFIIDGFNYFEVGKYSFTKNDWYLQSLEAFTVGTTGDVLRRQQAFYNCSNGNSRTFGQQLINLIDN
jgi:hypothetical protein